MSRLGSTSTRRLGTVIAASALTAAVSVAPAQAAPYDLELPAGLACPGFGVGLDIDGDSPRTREFRDQEGNLVRVITAGKGQALTFTNTATGESLSLRANGAVNITRPGPNGVSTVNVMGHNVVILFPSDVPAGPSTTLYVGRVSYTVDQQGTFTLLSTSGRSLDICSALAGS